MTSRRNRFLGAAALILLLAPAALAALPQDPATPAQKVTEFAAAARDITKFGGSMTEALAAQAKTESTSTQTLLTAVGQMLKEKAAGAGVDTAPSAVEAPAKRFVAATASVLGLKDKAIEPLGAALADAANEDVKPFLAKAEGRIYVGLCTAVIRKYIGPDGRASGTFEGMFKDLDKYDKDKIGDGFLEIFAGSSASGVREMAGEGVAQKGAKRHAPAVMVILKSDKESETIKLRAVYTLARLGERGPADQILANIKKGMDSLKKDSMSQQDAQQYILLANRAATIAQMIYDTDAGINYYENMVATIESVKDKLPAQFVSNNFQNTFYNLACLYAIKGDIENGFKSIEKAFAAGYENYKWANTDGDLSNLRKDPRFKAMIEKWESGKGKAEQTPASKPTGG